MPGIRKPQLLLFSAVLVLLIRPPRPAGAQEGESASATARAEHVILISVDGLRPDFYLDSSWPAPVLQQLAREGAHATAVRGIFPSVTYPSHATMVTGALPVRHGVHSNTPFEEEGSTGRWYWEYELIQAPTLWEAARRAGLKTAGLSWPVTVGAPIDRNFPEIWSIDAAVSKRAVLERSVRPEGFLEELEREATGRLVAYGPEGPTENEGYAWWDSRMTDTAVYLIGTYKPHFLAIHIIAADGAQHKYGREHAEVRKAVAGADRAIGRIVEAVERVGATNRTAIVVTGDHGFIDVHTRVAPNVWLAEAGLMTEPSEEKGRGEWRATFHTSAASALLHLRDPKDREAVEQVRRILAGLPEDVKRLLLVVERDELDRLGVDPDIPLALSGALGTSFTSSARGEAVRPAKGGNHGFLPELHPDIDTGFVAWGAGVTPGGVVSRMELVDIAPVIAELLGIEFDSPDGVLRPGLLAPGRSR